MVPPTDVSRWTMCTLKSAVCEVERCLHAADAAADDQNRAALAGLDALITGSTPLTVPWRPRNEVHLHLLGLMPMERPMSSVMK